MLRLFSIGLLFMLQPFCQADDPKKNQAEAVCRDKLAEVKRLAKNGCSKEIRTSIRDCAAAGFALGLCIELPSPVTCGLAAIEIDRCNDAGQARQECRASQEKLKLEIEKVKDRECFATISKDGKCIFICEKTGTSMEMLGMLDLRESDPAKALKFFKKP